ncbi:MAG TPA: energy transducer TonB [Syntrophorhabdaceae bacterium]|nr:energy transducer TonB [Syntrophorhabdaceae bacterium]HOL05992.1 energy transducer TonB [Syntrophorhabdaceae bacterium]HON85421.1 energy transducer TonB [Syntrophorhabdaceae bacterium]HQH43683.1 energy transducer TonB [Syntrophorhabdaceae bacterium]HQK46600.1 energy transducer TonB [Syntrophorhabdaceae bacterium]
MHWPKYFFISVAAHFLLLSLILFIPFKSHKVVETISVDFTILNSDYGTNKKGTGRGTGGSGVKGGYIGQEGLDVDRGHGDNKAQRQDNPQDSNKINTASDTRDVISLNPIKGDKIDYGEENLSHARLIKTGYGASGHGSGGLAGGSGVAGYGRGTGGGGGQGTGYGGGINLADYNYVRDAVMKNITYPEKARRMGLEGRVIISFVINEAGFINDVKILKSSGYTLLDEAVREALFKVHQFRKKSEKLVVQLPVEFRLR